eukprot:gene14089-20041_t
MSASESAPDPLESISSSLQATMLSVGALDDEIPPATVGLKQLVEVSEDSPPSDTSEQFGGPPTSVPDPETQQHTMSFTPVREAEDAFSQDALTQDAIFSLEDDPSDNPYLPSVSSYGADMDEATPPGVHLEEEVEVSLTEATIDIPLKMEEIPRSPVTSRAEAVSSELDMTIPGAPVIPGTESTAPPSAPKLSTEIEASEAPTSAPIRVIISEPERVETSSTLGIKGHYYRFPIITDSSMEGLQADRMEGCFIPPLPEKSITEGRIGGSGSHDDFMRLRRADLQAYLNAITSHPLLISAEPLKLFLLQMGDLARNPAWLALTDPVPSAKQLNRATSAPLPASHGGDGGTSLGRQPNQPNQPTPVANIAEAAKSGMGSLVSWVRASLANAATLVPSEMPPDEVSLRQAKGMMQDLQKLLQLATDSARMMCQDMGKMCEDYREFGRTMGMLARFEEAIQGQVGMYTDEGALAAQRLSDLTIAAICASKQHGIWKTSATKSSSTLVTLHDFSLLVPEAIVAMEERETALSHLHFLESELARTKLQLVQAQTSLAAGTEKKQASLSQLATSLELQMNEAQELYDVIKERNESELARFGLQRRDHFRTMLAEFAKLQAGSMRASADTWDSLAHQYEDGNN